MNARFIPALILSCLFVAGCHPQSASTPPALSPSEEAAAANALFLNQKTFDPWVLTNTNPNSPIEAYLSEGGMSSMYSPTGSLLSTCKAGVYQGGQLVFNNLNPKPINDADAHRYKSWLNMEDGSASFFVTPQNLQVENKTVTKNVTVETAITSAKSSAKFHKIWTTSDIVIIGDPEAQQVTHANLFYLLSSTYPGSDHSIPPMGLSSNIYGGHIFWDAEVFMFPALIVQHPEYAKPIIDYRFKLLEQAKKNAKAHGFAGAEYPWESADTGKELVGAEFAKERHITADVGWAAWQYYLWTGDKTYLKKEGWPILLATAQYWVSRVTRSADGQYHIMDVLGPDETAGVGDDDAWTNGVVKANLRAAVAAAGQMADTKPEVGRWSEIAAKLELPSDKSHAFPAENSAPMSARFAAKQADALLLCYPLQEVTDPKVIGPMLDFYSTHTIKNGPAMTASMESIIAARLGRGKSSLDLFHDSYRPFMRGPWDAFAEKRTSNRVYFCTGMGGCLQSVLYGFAGLNFQHQGKQVAGDLFADPHLPPGWGGLTVKGVKYHGKTYDLAMKPGNQVAVKAL